ncbi:hypothetical protein V757_06460 [Pelistega indica]|uniref:Uncharacterized protein n=1 Tax=Pelistega indica TaxID=1414851 RepID=V8G6S7_9BURK|nr:hypothetical protein [Pelistega indica]ETD71683.1 hypothetical protein V757_06460 [Pelistega indica]
MSKANTLMNLLNSLSPDQQQFLALPVGNHPLYPKQTDYFKDMQAKMTMGNAYFESNIPIAFVGEYLADSVNPYIKKRGFLITDKHIFIQSKQLPSSFVFQLDKTVSPQLVVQMVWEAFEQSVYPEMPKEELIAIQNIFSRVITLVLPAIQAKMSV